MVREIGVFVNEDGMTTFLSKPCQLVIFRKEQGLWNVGRKMSLNLGDAASLAELRIHMKELVTFLNRCNILLAEDFQGVALLELEKAGVGLWKVSGKPEPLLEYILSEEEKSAFETEQPEKNPFPKLEDRGDGRIFLSIVEVQRSGEGLTSKQVLLPVLQKGAFRELEVLCAHVPPWLEAEVVRRGWTNVMKRNDGREICVTITVK